MKVIRMTQADEHQWVNPAPEHRFAIRNKLRKLARAHGQGETVEIHFPDGVCADVVYPVTTEE